MREILFKAKRLDNGECVDGFYCCIGPAGQEKHYIIPEYASAFYGVEVDPSTVCQYTGLTDKNGKKIFEGDIVRRETAYYGKRNVYDEPVVWEDDIENDSFGEPYTSGYCIHGGNWEVIGNIHDGEGGQREEG
jgi:hypothetical protein